MRALKFRAWDTELKFFVDTTAYFVGMDGSVWFNLGDDKGRDNLIDQTSKLEVMQYTGLKDKHGNGIYEGDIVTFAQKKNTCPTNGCEAEVEYSITKFCPACGAKIARKDFIENREIRYAGGGFVLFGEDGNTYSEWPIYIAERYIEWMKVIGNIYENPELLEQP